VLQAGVQHVEQSRGAPQDHAGSQRQRQHRVRHEDNEQEVPHLAYPISLLVPEPDSFSEDACRSHNKRYTRCATWSTRFLYYTHTEYIIPGVSYVLRIRSGFTYITAIQTEFPCFDRRHVMK